MRCRCPPRFSTASTPATRSTRCCRPSPSDPGKENTTVTPIPGDVCWFTFQGDDLGNPAYGYEDDEEHRATRSIIDLAIFYGRNNLLINGDQGWVPGNVLGDIVEGLARDGRRLPGRLDGRCPRRDPELQPPRLTTETLREVPVHEDLGGSGIRRGGGDPGVVVVDREAFLRDDELDGGVPGLARLTALTTTVPPRSHRGPGCPVRRRASRRSGAVRGVGGEEVVTQNGPLEPGQRQCAAAGADLGDADLVRPAVAE